MRCQVLYFTFQRSIPPLSPHHQQMGPRNHQKFNKCVSSSHAEPPPPSWSRVCCHVHDGPSHWKAVQPAILLSPLRQQINQLTHTLSLSLSLTQQKCSAHEHDSALIRLLERISKEIPTDLHVLLLFQVAMAWITSIFLQKWLQFKTRGVSHSGLAIYIKRYPKAKE